MTCYISQVIDAVSKQLLFNREFPMSQRQRQRENTILRTLRMKNLEETPE